MTNQKPNLPKGIRDFGPEQMVKREFIFSVIRKVFRKFGFEPLETPSIENLSVLMGKYGDEGDQLLYKILNSGDFFKNISKSDLDNGSQASLRKISEKGLRYDLTVPFARYVATHHHNITFPFRRYQIQPVWRADRPQKGRYREFYQCDADIVGTDSLICEAEIVLMIREIFADLNISGYTISMNHRKVLAGLAKIAEGLETDFYVAIDKLEKLGRHKVLQELVDKGFEKNNLETVFNILESPADNEGMLLLLENELSSNPTAMEGISDFREVFGLVDSMAGKLENLRIRPGLARGLSYYTGVIFEVVLDDKSMGSLSGGGRYDSLTGLFGLPGVPGTGFSLGVDRMYDVMEHRGLFPKSVRSSADVLITWMDEPAMRFGLPLLNALRENGISAEIYPDIAKIKKQLSYANKKNIPFVIVIGEEEVRSGQFSVKELATGIQTKASASAVVRQLKEKTKKR